MGREALVIFVKICFTLLVCIYVSVCIYANECRYLRSLQESTVGHWTPGAGDAGSCELPNMDARDQTWVPSKSSIGSLQLHVTV